MTDPYEKPEWAAELKDHQWQFVETFLATNGSRALAVRATGLVRSSRQKEHSEAQRYLREPAVREAILAAQKELGETLLVTKEMVAEEHRREGFANIGSCFDEDGAPIPIHELDPEASAAIAGVTIEERHYDGKIVRTYKYRFVERLKSREALSKLLGHDQGEGDKTQPPVTIVFKNDNTAENVDPERDSQSID